MFIKEIKDRAYHKRYQVKYKRRRQGITDYYARKRLTVQDKNKYNSPKYRLVVRFTNRKVICQIVYAKLVGDVTMAQATSAELPRYGVKVGLTNYAAAYAVGLLVARRLLSKIGLADKYVGQTEVDGNYFLVEPAEGPRPFYALLDVGLKRTSTGSKVFAALKGACDGGLNIPHSENRFVGYDDEEDALDAETLRSHIFGGHVANYMSQLEEEDAAAYQRQFSRYIKEGIKADNIEDMYKKAHAAIRADPSFTKKEQKEPKTKKRWSQSRRSRQQRADRIRQKIASYEKATGKTYL